jgi:hypothetical protein
MSPACQYQEFAYIGFTFDSPEDLLLQLLPLGEEICKSYKDYELPVISVPQLSLQEAICHTRIIHSQLQHFTSLRERTTREMATHYKRNGYALLQSPLRKAELARPTCN